MVVVVNVKNQGERIVISLLVNGVVEPCMSVMMPLRPL